MMPGNQFADQGQWQQSEMQAGDCPWQRQGWDQAKKIVRARVKEVHPWPGMGSAAPRLNVGLNQHAHCTAQAGVEGPGLSLSGAPGPISRGGGGGITKSWSKQLNSISTLIALTLLHVLNDSVASLEFKILQVSD